MQEYNHILEQLEQFIKKYYSQVLLKGVFLFLFLGLFFFLIISGVEYFLWLNSTGRTILFGLFVLVELYLLFRYILSPLFYLFKVKKGIGYKDAAKMIGTHFDQIGDKLTNLLDLAKDNESSELLLASIAQRSKQLDNVPFSKAITYKKAIEYAKYSAIPISILFIIKLSGNWNTISDPYARVLNFDVAYEKPAPFSFKLLTPNLNVLENEAFTIQVITQGETKPEQAYIVMDDKKVLLEKENDWYKYTFAPPITSTNFNFTANEVTSKEYILNALSIPSISDFKMILDYPSYLNKKKEEIKGTGNATIPEGTKVSWQIGGVHTEKIEISTRDTTEVFKRKENKFQFGMRIFANLKYQITTSNKNIDDFEKLSYSFRVIKDAYPKIQVKQLLDSLNPNVFYYNGNVSDDYGITEIAVNYYEIGRESDSKKIVLNTPTENFTRFYYTFPSGLDLDTGKNYAFYFTATDNDLIHKGKTIKSAVFQQTILDENQLKNKELESQQTLIRELDKSLEKAKEQKEELEELNKNQKEKNSLNFNDQNKIKDFLKKQELQESLMQKFSKELKDNLQKTDNQDNKLNELLRERLERQEKEALKNEKLLEELNKIADKINKEELTKKLEELGKKQKNSERSLAQLVELTKRYYVTEKAAQLAKDLEKLSERQETLSKLNLGEDFSEKEQKGLNDDFKKIEEELNNLERDNNNLKKPLDLTINQKTKEGVKESQQDALEEIKKHSNSEQTLTTDQLKELKNKTSERQQSAAQKLKKMSEDLKQSSSSSDGSSVAEDAEMLRQILDNLILFSFKQEGLFDKLSAKETQDESQYSNTVKDQKELRNLFEHVDDSLFALSLRQAELSEFVNEQVTEVYYNIDKSLETMADGQFYQGISYQKYVLNAANSLADFLAEVMDNMQESMQMGQRSGESEGGFQLPDIIKGQQELGDKMGEQGKEGKQGESGEKGNNGEAEKGSSGEKGSEGEKGKNGDSGKNGQEGTKGEQGSGDGESGENDGNGGSSKNGSNGTSGESGPGNMSEEELKEIYEIYQQQQQIRQALEQQLENMINAGDKQIGKKLIRQMEDFENDLLENGITKRTIDKANTIQYELLKLENAALKQGKKEERESNSNTKDFNNPITTKPSLLDNYTNEIEILNRQALPLRQNFKNKVKRYFQNND